MKTTELTGAALDWAVAKCEGHKVFIKYAPVQVMYTPQNKRSWYIYRPSSNWAQGGSIIEREMIDIVCLPTKQGGKIWRTFYADGPTPLVAAMRCFVAAKLGDNVDVPKELTE